MSWIHDDGRRLRGDKLGKTIKGCETNSNAFELFRKNGFSGTKLLDDHTEIKNFPSYTAMWKQY